MTEPKMGRIRYVPLTARLVAVLRQHQHLRGQRVLVNRDGRSFTLEMVEDQVRWAACRSGLEDDGVHILRHTFCSHLAMRRVLARAIQALAGHANPSMTQRYMQLSPAAVRGAIELLNQLAPSFATGDIAETGTGAISK